MVIARELPHMRTRQALYLHGRGKTDDNAALRGFLQTRSTNVRGVTCVWLRAEGGAAKAPDVPAAVGEAKITRDKIETRS